MTQHHNGSAAVAASLNYAAWALWLIASSRFQTMEVVGPVAFWSLPIIVAAPVWILLLARVPRGVSLAHRAREGYRNWSCLRRYPSDRVLVLQGGENTSAFPVASALHPRQDVSGRQRPACLTRSSWSASIIAVREHLMQFRS